MIIRRVILDANGDVQTIITQQISERWAETIVIPPNEIVLEPDEVEPEADEPLREQAAAAIRRRRERSP